MSASSASSAPKAAPAVVKKSRGNKWSAMEHYELTLRALHYAQVNPAGTAIDWNHPEMRMEGRTTNACRHEYNERIKMHVKMILEGKKVTGIFDHPVTHVKRVPKDAASGAKRKAGEIDEDEDAAKEKAENKPKRGRGPTKKKSAAKVDAEVEDGSEGDAEVKPKPKKATKAKGKGKVKGKGKGIHRK